MTDKSRTLIVALLDRTGSMQSIRSDTEGAFDAFMQAQRDVTDDVGDDVTVTLYQFDKAYDESSVELVYLNRPLALVPPLELLPRGTTPLHDALATTVIRVGEQLADLPEDQRPGKVIFIVMTDGEENASVEYRGDEGRDRVKRLVTEQADRWGWDFHFLGAGIDAFQVAGALGFVGAQTVSVAHTGADVRAGYGVVTNSVTRSRKSRR